MAIKIEGSWREGWAYDIHTSSSTYLGQDDDGRDKYETTRTPMGELVYQLKYKSDQRVVTEIVDMLALSGMDGVDAIVPIPPSNQDRLNQPVYAIANEIGIRHRIAVCTDVLSKDHGSKELKSITDGDLRLDILTKSMRVANHRNLRGKSILIVDDLYRSGATLEVATKLLYQVIKVRDVFVLAMTKTRVTR